MSHIYMAILGLFVLPHLLFAQEDISTSRSDSYFKFDFSVGPNIDFPPSRQPEHAGLLSSRPKTAPSFQFKASYLFSSKLGAYTSLRLDFYDEKQTQLYDAGVISDLLEGIFAETFRPISSVKPSVDAGLMYRIEGRRWSMYPSIGIGHATYAAERQSSRSHTNDDRQSVRVTYQQDASFVIATAGLSANYFISPKSFFTVHTKYQQPLQPATASIIKEIDNVQVEEQRYSSRQVGRNVYIGLGYGFLLGNKQKYAR